MSQSSRYVDRLEDHDSKGESNRNLFRKTNQYEKLSEEVAKGANRSVTLETTISNKSFNVNDDEEVSTFKKRKS